MRYARYLAVILVSLALVAIVLPTPSYAGLEFCSTDPIFKVDGKTVRVLVNLAPASLRQADWPEPIEVELTAPEGTNPRVVATPGPLPVKASAEEEDQGYVKVEIEVPEVDGYQEMQVVVVVNGRQVASGTTTDREIELTFPWP